jgi:hypothetical protein
VGNFVSLQDCFVGNEKVVLAREEEEEVWGGSVKCVFRSVLLSAVVLWCYGAMVLRCYGATILRCYVAMVLL